MLEKLTKYAGLIPLAAIVVYVLGYISLNSYLQSFGINENIGLDFNILKLGVLISILIGPIVILAFSTFKFNDYSTLGLDVSNEVITTLHDALGYTIMYAIGLGALLFKFAFDLPTCLMISFLIIGLILNKIRIPSKYLKFTKGIFLFVPFFTLCFSGLSLISSGKMALYSLQISMCLICAFLRIWNKEGITFQMSNICSIVIVIIYSSTCFGAFLVPKIPSQFGGEKRALGTYFLNASEIDKIKNTDLKVYITKSNSITIDEVYSTSEKYYFKTSKNKIFSIPKSYITVEEINIPSGYPQR